MRINDSYIIIYCLLYYLPTLSFLNVREQVSLGRKFGDLAQYSQGREGSNS
jgi:phage FluMu gp28-like protein